MSFSESIEKKICSHHEALQFRAQWSLLSKKVVFTNGCFDILHKGHVTYLAQSADLGHKLIVGLNSDVSVKLQNKGDNRPLQDESSRAAMMASLSFVDLVVLFDDETPEALINALSPDVLVKGGDYEIEEIVGHESVQKAGGLVTTLPIVPGYSTSAIEARIKG